MEHLPFLDSLLPDKGESKEHFACLENPSTPEDPREDPGLGVLSKLSRELRDGIYDLCTREKHYEVRANNGPLRFQVHAPLTNLRLVSKAFSSDQVLTEADGWEVDVEAIREAREVSGRRKYNKVKLEGGD